MKRQEQMCRQLARSRGWTVVAVESDNSISAFSGKERPAFERVLAMATGGEIDVILAYAVDRITRSLDDWVRIDSLSREHGVALVTAIGDADLSNPNGRTLAGMMALMARQESERKSDRQRAANAQRASEGRPWPSGVRAFGYTLDRSAIVPEEAAAIQDGARKVLAGVPLVQIAREWVDAGLSSARRGKRGWTSNGVRSVMLNPLYIRTRVYDGQTFTNGDWPAILDEATHLALVSLLTDPLRTKGNIKGGRTAQNLLSGVATCAVCGMPVRASSDTRTGELRYRCSSPSVHIWVPRASVDAWVEGWMIAFLARPTNIVQITEGDDREKVTAVEDEAHATRIRLGVVDQRFADGEIDWTTYRRLATKLEARMDALEQKLASSAKNAVARLFVSARTVAAVRERWEGLPIASRRLLIAQFAEVVIDRANRGPGEYDPSKRVTITRR
nr:recombinase family protein [Cellulomonas hominis]